MKKTTLLFLLILATSVFSDYLFAVTAYPNQVKFEQPNGKFLTIQLMGDEFIHWAKTSDGYTIMFNKDGFYEYAILDQKGDMIPSGIIAVDLKDRSSKDQNFISQLNKDLFFSESQVSIMTSIKKMREQEMKSSKAFPTTGNRKLVCILMGFKDKAFTKTQAEFNNLFNQVNYTTGGATGSVKDFYLDASYTQFNLDVTVAGPFTASQNMSYYGANDAYGNDVNPRALVTEAVNAADATVNFANFDNDNNGTVDGVYVIYAGYGEEAGGDANTIWAHAWAITPVTKDGKTISSYSCSAELRGNSGTTITSIGVICHEFGHVLGAPDYYDTNYSTGGNFLGTGNWDIMASGSWNNNGITPAQHNAYTKVKVYGWATSTVLTAAANITVTPATSNKSFYQINSATANEYWLIENRQKVDFDAYLPGHGLIIYHVHSTIATATTSNNINATYPQKMYPVCANATTNPGSTPASYGTINGGGCPFPGTSSKTSFTDATIPNMKSWAAANTNKPITEIKEISGNITFKFMGGVDATSPSIPTNLTSSNITTSSIKLNWTASTDDVGVTGYEVYKNGTLAGTTSTTSYTLSGLTANTTYSLTVKAYDAAGNKSVASNALSVKTQPNYCTSKGMSVASEWIDYVALGGMTNTTAANAGYGNFTSKIANVNAGATVTINFSAGFKTIARSEYWGIWIDWNNNGVFETSEKVITVSASTSSGTFSKTFTVPSTARIGNTRMRVSMKYMATPTACETFNYGEVEDYTVNVSPAKSSSSTTGKSSQEDLEQENYKFNYTVFPNPVRDNILRITLSNSDITDYYIYSIEGKKVLEGKINNQNEEININELRNGIFIIKINNVSYKFIKE